MNIFSELSEADVENVCTHRRGLRAFLLCVCVCVCVAVLLGVIRLLWISFKLQVLGVDQVLKASEKPKD